MERSQGNLAAFFVCKTTMDLRTQTSVVQVFAGGFVLHRQDVDGLRGLAVLAVVLCHAGFAPFMGGYVGVDMFFVISGYVITTSLLREAAAHPAGRISIWAFYQRRALRLLPALYFVLLTTLAAGWVFSPPFEYMALASYAAATLLFIANVYYGNLMGYFGPDAAFMPLLHTWSLSVEEQFYIFFPLIFQLFRRYFLILVPLLVLGSFGYGCWASATNNDWAFFSSFGRFWEILVGVAAAKALHHRPKGLPSWFGVIGLAGLAASVCFGAGDWPLPGWPLLLPVLGTALVILSTRPAKLSARLLSFGPILRLGQMSYSVYLVHQPLFVFTRLMVGGSPSATTMMGAVIACLLLSFLLNKFVEDPIRFRLPAGLRRGWVVFFGALAGGGCVFALALAIHFSRGAPQRAAVVLAGDIGHQQYHLEQSARFFPCIATDGSGRPRPRQNVGNCLQSKADGVPTVVLLGNSHADHLMFGVADALANENVGDFTQQGPPLRSNSLQFENFAALDSGAGSKLVLVTDYWNSGQSKPEELARLELELASTLRSLQRPGRVVALVGDVPKFSFLPSSCKYVLPAPSLWRCTRPRNEQEKDSSATEAMLRHVASETGVPYIPLLDALCDKDTCSMLLDKTVMYRDGNHLNIPGSIYVGRKLVMQIGSLGVFASD